MPRIAQNCLPDGISHGLRELSSQGSKLRKKSAPNREGKLHRELLRESRFARERVGKRGKVRGNCSFVKRKRGSRVLIPEFSQIPAKTAFPRAFQKGK